jgi:predicted  nucleic acid-binding Zn-ribbon protein
MFKELNDNLNSIDNEVIKLKTAVSHIEKSKEAAMKAVVVAETTNREFRQHLENVTTAVDEILKPHKELISTTEKLVKIIESVDFPSRFTQQEKEIKMLKFLLIGSIGISLFGTILILVLR